MVLFIHRVRVCVCVSYVRRRRLSFLSVDNASCLVLVLTSLTAEGSEDREHLVLTSCVR